MAESKIRATYRSVTTGFRPWLSTTVTFVPEAAMLGSVAHLMTWKRSPKTRTNLLRKRVGKGVDPAAQWYEVWDIIFVNATRPPDLDPYLGNPMKEVMAMVHAIWVQERSGVMRQFSKRREASKDSGKLHTGVDELLIGLFDEVQARLEHRISGESALERQ
ncbi:hypothetical protein B0H66DRAFT_565545 [Apodospora peruviana]|uniref:Uncharacterized protein n=1 Tax=Apodospora peruviana TaxID=516989 RepID=A0AAE0HYZ1_9PEZI|nr:hypothetical protein B0H66DRAFT_565545 [Apodospora peruviana]